MAEDSKQFSSLAQSIAMLIMIFVFIWTNSPLQYWLLIFGHILFFQFLVDRDSLTKVGLRPDKLSHCFYKEGQRLWGIIVLLLFAGLGIFIFTGHYRNIDLANASIKIPSYLGFAFFQQYILNSYFVNRFADFYGDVNHISIPLGAASVFSFVHFPNILLINLGFVAGYVSAIIFLRHRNLYFLALAHFLIGAILNQIIPDSISHGMRVGPGY